MTESLKSSLELLNEQQRRAVLHSGNPLLILAGAGSGKTRVITVKIAYLIQELGIDPRSILAVTFTNKAANEMRQRAEQLSPDAHKVVIRTFHSFGAWLLRRNATAVNLSTNFTIYDDDDSLSLLATLFPDHSRQHLRQFAALISRAKDSCLGVEDDLSTISHDPELSVMYKAYQNRLLEIGNVDFGDLIMRPIELLEENEMVGNRIRDRFQVILVDEYQDSNLAQHRLLSSLYRPGSYICVVGDDDQSIYRFRGAEVQNILGFPKQFEGTDIVRLEQNYRSTNPILEVAGAVVQKNKGRLGKNLWTSRDGGELPLLARLSDQDAELDFVLEVLRDGFEGETAILYRTNAQSRSFETRFLQEGIAYKIVGTLRFYEREEVKDAIALLKLAANPRDQVAFNRIVNKPSRGIGKVALEKIDNQLAAARGNLVHAAEYTIPSSSKKTAKGLAEFIKLMETADRFIEKNIDGLHHLGEVIEHLLEVSGLGQYHINQDEITGSGKVQNLEELVNAASLYPPNAQGLTEFLEAIELDSAREQNDTDASTILITMHNTKGLEFDRVIITGLENEIFPRVDSADEDALEEERRLFYVAITRAKKQLYFTTCSSRRIHGRTQSLSPSVFLSEIPEECIVDSGRRPKRNSQWSDPFGDQDPWSPWRNTSQSAAPENDRPPMEFPPGQLIYHDEYGTGEVVTNNYNGSEEVVFVRFESGNTAQFIPRFSALEKISRE